MTTTEVAHVDGRVVVERGGESDTPCVCCPSGRHVWRRYVLTVDDEPSVAGFVAQTLAAYPELEGRTVRVTLSLVED